MCIVICSVYSDMLVGTKVLTNTYNDYSNADGQSVQLKLYQLIQVLLQQSQVVDDTTEYTGGTGLVPSRDEKAQKAARLKTLSWYIDNESKPLTQVLY